MKYTSSEVKSGFLILLSLGLLLALCFAVGGAVSGDTREFKVRFGYISGLEKNAPVYYAGHEVGKVVDIQVQGSEPRPVMITARLSMSAVVRSDSQGFVDTLGLMGEKFLEITPGTPGQPELQTGQTVEGVDPIPVHVMVRKMDHLADLMDEMVSELNPVMAQVNLMVKGHEEELSKTISNIHETSANVRDLTQELKHHPWRLVRKG